MSKDFGTIAKNITECRESPRIWLPGIDDYLQIQVDGTDAISNPTMSLYENGVDVSATKLTGAMSVVGRVIKTKTLTGLVGGSTYMLHVFAEGGAAIEATVICTRLGENPSKHQVAHNSYRINESPVLVYPSQTLPLRLTISGEGTISSASMVMYKGYSDDSANVLTGSVSVSGRVITLSTIENLSGGVDYIAYVFYTDGAKPTCAYFEVLCPKLGAY